MAMLDLRTWQIFQPDPSQLSVTTAQASETTPSKEIFGSESKFSKFLFVRVNGGTFSLNGSCKIHGNSTDTVNGVHFETKQVKK